MIKNIQKITSKIKHIEERLKEDMPPKRKHWFKRQLFGKKATLRHLCKLYVWGVK